MILFDDTEIEKNKLHQYKILVSIGNVDINLYYPNFEFFHKKLRFGVFLSVDIYLTFKNSKEYVLMVPGPKY